MQNNDPIHNLTVHEIVKRKEEVQQRRFTVADMKRIKASLLPDSEALALIEAFECVCNAAFWYYSAVPDLAGILENERVKRNEAALIEALRTVGWMMEVGDDPA